MRRGNNTFLRLPLQRVNQTLWGGQTGVLRLSRLSQILTFNEYIQKLIEQEVEKTRQHELAKRKKQQMMERKAERQVDAATKEAMRVEKLARKVQEDEEKNIRKQ